MHPRVNDRCSVAASSRGPEADTPDLERYSATGAGTPGAPGAGFPAALSDLFVMVPTSSAGVPTSAARRQVRHARDATDVPEAGWDCTYSQFNALPWLEQVQPRSMCYAVLCTRCQAAKAAQARQLYVTSSYKPARAREP